MQNIGSKQLLDTRNDVLRRPGEKILDTFVDEPLKRGRSVKKHDRRLKLDDIKDINSVLREI